MLLNTCQQVKSLLINLCLYVVESLIKHFNSGLTDRNLINLRFLQRKPVTIDIVNHSKCLLDINSLWSNVMGIFSL